MITTVPDIPAGDIAFFDNYLPSLEDGSYRISTQVEITGGIDTDSYFENPITQDFEVRGPQFSLPATEVHSVYPPANSNSAYDQYLPNIVLNKRVLPWERSLDAADKTIPWLCLLVFAEGEITIDPDTNSALTTGTVTDFLAPDADVLKPAISTDTVAADVLSSRCSSIKITEDVFKLLTPKVEELKYLCHVRQVDTGDQAIMGFEEMGWFSVVTGNRLLKTTVSNGTRFFVHLVSLEGYLDIMNGNIPWPKKSSKPTESKDIALVSLYNWTFLSQPETLNFKDLVENLALPGEADPDNLLLRPYVTNPENPGEAMQATLTRLQNGYLPLNYKLPTGENSFAWYRGPFTPTIAQPLPRASDDYHFPSSSSLMIYDKTTGVFDQSYAAAWSMGRALALADRKFSAALLKYRKRAYALLGQLTDRLSSLDQASVTDLQEIVNNSVVRDAFKKTWSSGGDLLFAPPRKKRPKSSFTLKDELRFEAQVKRKKISAKSVDKATALNDSGSSPVDLAKDFFENPIVRELLEIEVKEDLAPIGKWLAHLQLLYGIPFNHLVPDQSMLPVESLRFFYVDQNWLDCLVDGALSIGVQSSKDSFFNSVMRGVINDAVSAAMNSIRDAKMGIAINDVEADSSKEALSGILIRSAVVAGWPGLVVKAFKGDFATGTPLKLLRMDRLSSNVLLCIFLDIPDTVLIAEPQQGLCFGVEDDDIINLRQLADPPGKPTGQTFPSNGGFTSFFRPIDGTQGNYVLNINDGAGSVVQTPQTSDYLNTIIGPAQFALEMVKAPEEISFVGPDA